MVPSTCAIISSYIYIVPIQFHNYMACITFLKRLVLTPIKLIVMYNAAVIYDKLIKPMASYLTIESAFCRMDMQCPPFPNVINKHICSTTHTPSEHNTTIPKLGANLNIKTLEMLAARPCDRTCLENRSCSI